jgi:TolB protein
MLVLIGLLAPLCADAAFPGRNGKLAFGTTSFGGDPSSVDIWTVEPSGENFAPLTTEPDDETWPAWSANGRWIAFSKTPRPVSFPCCNRAGDIWIARADGTGQRRLTDGPEHDTTPSWSPSGGQIVFARGREVPGWYDLDYDIYVINRDGTGLRLLTGEPRRSELDPAWSPDGGRIAFATDIVNPDGLPHPEVVLGLQSLRSDGGDPQMIVPAGRLAYEPDWSPDGGSIAYTNGRQIFTVNPDGTGVTAIPNGSAFSRVDPSWSPDGSRIAFGGPLLGHMSVDGSSATTLHSGILGLSWQPLGPRREDFKNRPAFCRTERQFLGEDDFAAQYRSFGGCVSAGR